MLHGEEAVVFADAGYQGADKRLDANPSVRWQVAMRSGIEEKHAAAQDAVCAIEPVDGPAPIDGGAGTSRPESRQIALNRTKILQCRLKRRPGKT